MKIKTYKQAQKYLESFVKPFQTEKIIGVPDEFNNPLGRMRYLLNLLGNPQDKFPSVVVSGTSGKTSTTYYISELLKNVGYKVGMTISPHLQKINERMQINGNQISDKELVQMVSSIVDTIRLMKKSKVGEPSYFEILLAIAFLYFAKEKVDIVVAEVGLEGKYDGTNVLNRLAFVYANVSLDHTQILGKTIEEIAREGVSGIKNYESRIMNQESKEGQDLIVVTGINQSSVIKIVEEQCKEVGAVLYKLGKDFSYKLKKFDELKNIFDFKNKENYFKDIVLSMAGEHQVQNASLALETVLSLERFGFKVNEETIRKSFSSIKVPGRFEIIQFKALRPPRQFDNSSNIPSVKNLSHAKAPRAFSVILDGAHNPAKMEAFIRSLKKIYPKTRKIFIVAFKKDKDIKNMLDQIFELADVIIFTQYDLTTDTMRSSSIKVLHIKDQISKIKNNKKIKIYQERDSKKALEKAIEIADKNSMIVVTGSLYLVGEIRDLIYCSKQ